jgi:hypothetical protein
MPWTTILEDENGQAIETCSDFLDYNEFNHIELSQFKLFKYMLPYGDTTFNEAQIPDLISDLEILKQTSKQKDIIDKIILLAHKCPETTHSYLKFYGD